MAKVYAASSWRNPYQPHVVERLRSAGHRVYDFKNPPNSTGFEWGKIDPCWGTWTAAEYRAALRSPEAQRGFASDFDAMQWAEVGVLLLPCGRSAHLELGWMAGRGKKTIIWTRDGEPLELMALLCSTICITEAEVLAALAS